MGPTHGSCKALIEALCAHWPMGSALRACVETEAWLEFAGLVPLPGLHTFCRDLDFAKYVTLA